MSLVLRASLTTAAALALASTPALAKKASTVTVPASLVKDASSKLCMPRTMSSTVGKDKSQPATLCMTVDEWSTHGVTVATK